MYDVKGSKIELVHDFKLDDNGLKSYNMLIKRHGLKYFVDNWQEGSESKNIKIGSRMVDYLIEEGYLQEFIEALPKAESVTIELEEVKPAQDLAQFIKVEKLLKDKNISMYIAGENESTSILYRVEDISNAAKQLDDWANEINSAIVDTKPLSPLEKFIYAYMIAKDREGKECEFNDFLSRNIVAVLNNDYCVCYGYVSLLNELCSKIGIQCTHKHVSVPGPHDINCVIIKDDKYDIDGLYYSDPTKDRKDLGNTLFSCLLPSVEDVFDLYFKNRDKCGEWHNEEKELFPNEESLKRAQENTKKIGYQNILDALFAVFKSKYQDKQDAVKATNQYLNSSVKNVLTYLDRYKGNWVHDAAKAKGFIQDYKR